TACRRWCDHVVGHTLDLHFRTGKAGAFTPDVQTDSESHTVSPSFFDYYIKTATYQRLDSAERNVGSLQFKPRPSQSYKSSFTSHMNCSPNLSGAMAAMAPTRSSAVKPL